MQYSCILQFPRPVLNPGWDIKATQFRLAGPGGERHVQDCKTSATFKRAGAFQQGSPEEGSRVSPPPSSSTHLGRAPKPPRAPRPEASPLPRKKKIGGGQWEAGKASDVRWPAGSLLPGDPSGVSLSPPPARGGLYRAPARLPPSSSSPRAAVGSARGGGGLGTPGRGEALFASLLFPHAALLGHPQNQSTLLLPSPSFLAPCQLLVPPPPLSRYSSWLRSGCAAPKVPPDLPACNSDPYRIQKHVDHTSARLLRYRLLVQGTQGSEERRRAKQEDLRVFRLCLLSSAFGEPLPTLTFGGLGRKNPEVCSSRAGWCLVGREKERGGRTGRRERL